MICAMRHAIILQHVPGEGPGRIAQHLTHHDLAIEIRHLYRGDTVPATLEDALLIVMGGPMGVGDIGNPHYPFLANEIALLRHRVDHDLPTLGICLGAQLLAHAAGATVAPNRDAVGKPVREVGWEAVTFTAREEAVLSGLREQEPMLHWHGDTFTLPTGAVRLGSTPRCLNQGFRLKNRLFGLQFHPEVDQAMVVEWVRDDADYVLGALGPTGGEQILADTKRILPDHVVIGNRLLANLVKAMLA